MNRDDVVLTFGQEPKRDNSRYGIRENFSKTAYDANTLLMLQLRIPEEVAKQKEELTQCKEFEDERVKQEPEKKLKDADSMKLADKSVTGKQEVNKGTVNELKSKKYVR